MRLGLIGYGTIARELVACLARDVAPCALAALVSSRARAALRVDADLDAPFGRPGNLVCTDAPSLLAWRPDLIVECAGHAGVATHVPACLAAGIDVVVVSVGALADDELSTRLARAAARGGARVVLPAGAIGGLDLLGALALGGLESVVYRGRKPPAAWRGTPAEVALDLDALDTATVFFEGDARTAARRYPKNANVAATLALHGLGFERTRVALVADPDAPGNVHEIEVRAASGDFTLRVVGRASAGNARTSLTTVYSVLREIARHRESCPGSATSP